VIKKVPSITLIAMIWGTFFGLFKADFLGYAQLNQSTLDEAKNICWKMISI
jgi:hypothetical protein